MDTQKTIEVLNSLIEINNDRIVGYETALNETEEEDLKSLFSQFRQTSLKCKSELIHEVHELGGIPVEGTKTSGKFFRVWMDMKFFITCFDRTTILYSCEHGEDAAVDTYNSALSNNLEVITTKQQSMLTTQQALLLADHDYIKNLRIQSRASE